MPNQNYKPLRSPEAPEGTQSIQRTMSVLDAFTYGDGWLALKDIAARVSLPKPTTHRILNALASTRLIEASVDGAYRLGPGAAELGYRANLARLESPPRATPFSAVSFTGSSSFSVRDWNGAASVSSFDVTFEREYFAIRGGAAVLDVSPLFLYEFRGPDAEAAVQRILTRDVTRCATNQVFYSAWCDDQGYLLQDGNLIRLGPDHFRLSAAGPALRWFQDASYGFDVEVSDIGDGVAKLAVQGPLSRRLLERVLDADSGVRSLGYFRGCSATFRGHELYVTRTGFTGDLGYELWLDLPTSSTTGAPSRGLNFDLGPAEEVWKALLSSELGPAVVPMGLEALDAARIEAGLILIDVDYFSSSHALLEKRHTTPDEAGLGWTAKLVKGNDFLGRAKIEEERKRGAEWQLVGLSIDWTELERVYAPHGLRPQMVGRPPSREPMPVRADGVDASGPQIGQVTSSFFSPRLKRQLALAMVRSEHCKLGNAVQIGMRVEMERALLRATVVKLPFYDPPHKRAKVPESRSGSQT